MEIHKWVFGLDSLTDRTTMKQNKTSILAILVLVTLMAVLFGLIKLANQGGTFVNYVTFLLMAVIAHFLVFACFFLVVYPLGAMNRLVDQSVKEPDSPFANQRLPEQLVPPTSDPERAH